MLNIKKHLAYFCRLCYNNKFIVATDGNLSVKLANGNILTTASNTVKGKITASQIIETNENGTKITGKGKPTKELKLHLFIYNKRKDIKAVIHTHPRFCSAFAVAGLPINKITLPEVFLKLGKIALAHYGTPYTDELPKSIENYVMNYNAVLLANHGLVTFGKTLEEAYYFTEKAEHFAEISFYARMLGGEKELTEQQQNKLKKIIK
jgi:L-fuculose-phosphate aldolase